MMSTLTGEQNERKVLHFVESILPCLIGKHEDKFKNDWIVASLKDHWVHDADSGVKTRYSLKFLKANDDFKRAEGAVDDL